MNLSEINLYDIGNTFQLVGAIWGGHHSGDSDPTLLFCLFPDEAQEFEPELSCLPSGMGLETLPMDLDEWNTFLRQTDLLETEILAGAHNGALTKAILRKTARQIEARVMWTVFARDGFKCRYCGQGPGIPLTVDHLILWEEGGPSMVENLVASCRPCNRTRGNMAYEAWLVSQAYLDRSCLLSQEIKQANLELVEAIKTIPRQVHIHTR